MSADASLFGRGLDRFKIGGVDWEPNEPVVVVTKSLSDRALAEGYDLADAIRTAFLTMKLNGRRVAVLELKL